jgi:hypothetical protein
MPMGRPPAKLTVDFSGIEVRQGSVHLPEGDYLVEVANCEMLAKKDDESRKYLNWALRVVLPEAYRGKTVYYRTSLVKESLWNLRKFLVDLLGEDKVPQKAVDIPLAAIVARKPQVGVTLQDDEYNGKIKSEVAVTFSKSEYQSDQKTLGADAVDDSNGQSEETDEDTDEIDLDDL